MLITNGTCVSRIIKTRAGSKGRRRRHDTPKKLRRAPAGPLSTAGQCRSWRRRWPLTSELPPDRPRGDLLAGLQGARRPTSARRSPPRTAACTGCRRPGTRGSRRTARPGRPGRFVVPGLSIGRRVHRLQRRVGERRRRLLVLGDLVGRLARALAGSPPSRRRSSTRPALRYSGPVAHAMYFHADVRLLGGLRDGERAQDHSHPDACVLVDRRGRVAVLALYGAVVGLE